MFEVQKEGHCQGNGVKEERKGETEFVNLTEQHDTGSSWLLL